MKTRGRQRTLHPARREYLLNLVRWHSGSGGSRGPEGSGLPRDVWQHPGNVHMLNIAVNHFLFPAPRPHFCIRRVHVQCEPLFVSLLLASTVGFIYHFIYLFGGAADGQTFSLWSSSEGPTRLRSPAITSNLAAAEIDPPRKASWC